MIGAVFSAAVAFGLIQWSFRFLVWYTRDEDPLFRKKLDKLWDALQERTAVQVTQSSLQQIAEGLRRLTGSPSGSVIAGLIIAFANLAAIAVAAAVWRCEIDGSNYCSGLITTWTYYFWGNPATDVFSACLATMIGYLLLISLASLLISHQLIRLAASVVHLISLIGLLIGALVVIAIAGYTSWWLYVALNPYIIWQGESVPCVGELSFYFSETAQAKFELLSQRVDRYVKSFPGLGIYWVGVWLGTVSAFPLILALLASSTLLLIRAMPKLVNDFLVKCLYLISTDNAPVLSYVGTIASGIAALVSFFVSL